jgi:hypothetical protein
LHAPQLALVAQAKLTDDLQLGIQTFLLERTSRLLERLPVCARTKIQITVSLSFPLALARRSTSPSRRRRRVRPRRRKPHATRVVARTSPPSPPPSAPRPVRRPRTRDRKCFHRPTPSHRPPAHRPRARASHRSLPRQSPNDAIDRRASRARRVRASRAPSHRSIRARTVTVVGGRRHLAAVASRRDGPRARARGSRGLAASPASF